MIRFDYWKCLILKVASPEFNWIFQNLIKGGFAYDFRQFYCSCFLYSNCYLHSYNNSLIS